MRYLRLHSAGPQSDQEFLLPSQQEKAQYRLSLEAQNTAREKRPAGGGFLWAEHSHKVSPRSEE